MSQADQQVQNAAFPAVRTDINDNLAALFSQSSGASAPAVTVAFQPWIDTSSSPAVWKVRNAANTGWITIGTIDATTFNTGGITAIANGGTGKTTASEAINALVPSQSGNGGKSLTTDGTSVSWATAGTQLVQSTAVASTSGTSITFTGIPSWAKRITVMFSGVSTNGTSVYQVQLGTTSGIETSGYVGSFMGIVSGATPGGGAYPGAGYVLPNTVTAAALHYGLFTLSRLDSGSNVWVASGHLSRDSAYYNLTSGSKTLSGTLDRIRITTVNGTDTFDAGTINIMYEG